MDPEIRVVQCGGSRLNYRRPLVSADSKYLLCVSGDSIKVFSTVTEECIHVLWSHRDLVTGIEFNPNNPLQLYSCSLDGTIKLWDFIDGILIKTFHIGYKMFSLYSSKHDTVFVIAENKDSSENFQLLSIKLPKSTEQECEAKNLTILFADVNQSPKSTAVGRNGEYIVTVKALCLFIYFKNEKLSRFSLSSSSKKGANNTFTVVTCHPTEDCIATGHKDGRIRLWRNFNHKQDYTYSTLHWHHDSVADLAFSAEGTILFSGGVESVLVQWSHSLEHKREFLPRLGGAIQHIATSSDGSLLCTSHVDNKITIIDANLKVSGIIQGLLKGRDVKTGLLVDPRSKALVLNGKPGHLQFYSLHDDKHFYNLDIVQQEFVNQAGLQHIELVKAAFNAKGNWLTTVEELKRNETSHLEVQMKFWEYVDKLQSFVLNTTINWPHEDQISSLSFKTGSDSDKDVPTLVTTGNDGLFKVWVLEDNSDIYLTWRAQFNALVLQPDSVSENIAAFTFSSGSSTMFIFNPVDPEPLYVHTNVCSSCVRWAVFVPRSIPEVLPLASLKWLSKSRLYFLTENQDLMTFSTKSTEEMLTPLSKQLAPEESLPFTPFFALLERKRQQIQLEKDRGGNMPLDKSSLASCKVQESFAVKELLQTPAHVLPPAAILCSLFVNSLLISQEHTSGEQDGKDLDLESDKTEEGSDGELIGNTESQHPILTGDSYTTSLKLLKSEEKELRRFRRKDFAWVSSKFIL
ncbi:WD repeat-containing protein 75 isoform X2 [Engystomops pustulosus]|uniref:WD repeat-containing protein 75 isoform X2 n=1 Tax=Engystomops pustulosus TaxID=76066 RepID=UPI003AFAE145